MLRHIGSCAKDRVEVLHFLAACTTAFYLWMRIDELFNMKHKYLELNIEHSGRNGYFYHKATIFRRKNDKKRNKRKPRAHEAHYLSEI